jgi:hypothetical protein
MIISLFMDKTPAAVEAYRQRNRDREQRQHE